MSRLDNFDEILNSYNGREPAIEDSFGIEEFLGYYRIHGIQHRGETVTCDFAKDVLPAKTQDEHVLLAVLDDFRAASAPLVYALFKKLWQMHHISEDEHIEKARRCLERNFAGDISRDIFTLSRAIYHPIGGDEVIHDYRQLGQHKINECLAGPDGQITDKQTIARQYCQAILDTNDPVEDINSIMQWITNRANIYVTRLNGSDIGFTKEARVVGFHNGRVGMHITSIDDLNQEWPALGIRLLKKVEK